MPKIEREPFDWLNDDSIAFLENGYLTEGVDAQQRVRNIADAAEDILKIEGFADKFYDYMGRGWFSLSSPIWSNFGLERGLPISCFSSYVPDTMDGIMFTAAEIGMMSKFGGGTSAYFGDVRGRGAPITNNGESEGSVNFMRLFDTLIDVTKQGTCYIPGTEVLTDQGFVDFREVEQGNHQLAQVDSSNNISFTKIYELTANDKYDGEIIRFHNGNMDVTVTGNHNMVINRATEPGNEDWCNWNGSTEFVKATDLKLHGKIRFHKAGRIAPIDDVIQAMGATMHFSSNDVLFAASIAGVNEEFFRRNLSKFEVFKSAVNEIILFDEQETEDEQALGVTDEIKLYLTALSNNRIYGPILRGVANQEHLESTGFDNIGDVTSDFVESLFHEIGYWQTVEMDSAESFTVKGQSFEVSNVIQALAAMSGRSAVAVEEDGKFNIEINKQSDVNARWVNKEVQDYQGSVYCAIVPQGRLVIRHNGKTLICGNTRRGSMAAYLPIDHPDINEFLNIRSDGAEIQRLFNAVTVTDQWMKEMIDGDDQKRTTWARVLKSRRDQGTPYIFFTDNVNNNKPQVYKDKDMKIHGSNLCAEIMLPTNEEESFVCNLSSLNLLHFDEWKDTDAVETLTFFLDAVMTQFIEQAKKIPFLEKSVRFAERHRALGIGVLGWHSYLQANMIPFESLAARFKNKEMFEYIEKETKEASRKMADMYGEPEVMKGYGMRNSTTMAIAPTTSSAFILGQVSQSIEPLFSNYFVKDTAKRKTTYRNKYLAELLESYGKNTEDVWLDIMNNNGSVQHLDFLSDNEKMVFKTFYEISQVDVILLAAQRQKYIDQGQSLNIFAHSETPAKDLNQLYITAWQNGIKTLYYQHGQNASQEFNRSLVTCTNCEG